MPIDKNMNLELAKFVRAKGKKLAYKRKGTHFSKRKNICSSTIDLKSPTTP